MGRGHRCSSWLAGAAALLLWAAPRPAAADGAADLLAGIHAYDEGEPARAEPLLHAALKSLTKPRERGLAWLYVGLSRAARSDAAGARKAMRAALVEDPELSPNREAIPPAVLVLYDAVRRTVKGDVVIDASEQKARVYLDGENRGLAPMALRLGVGRHHLRVLSADGNRVFEAPGLLVGARQPLRVIARLVPRFGRLQLSLRPLGTEVWSEGRLVATTPAAPLPLPAGRAHLTFRAPGYEDMSRDVVVAPDNTTVLELRLRPKPIARAWYHRRRTWGWISIGLAGAAATAGLLLGVAARSTADDINAQVARGTLDDTRYDQLAAQASSRADAANVFLGLAGVAAAAGLTLVIVGDRHDRNGRSVRIAPTVGGAALAGRF